MSCVYAPVMTALTPKQKAQAKANAKARGTKAGAYDYLREAGKPIKKTSAKKK